MKSQTIKRYLKILFITLLICLFSDIVEAFVQIFLSFDNFVYYSRLVPIISFIFWVVLLAFLSLKILRSFEVSFGQVFGYLIIFWIASTIFWIVVPHSWRLVGGNYYGLEYGYAQQTPQGMVSDLNNGFVYKKNDSELDRRIAGLKDNEKYFRVHPTLFWQTATLFGFHPSKIKGYQNIDGYYQLGMFYISIGIVAIIQYLIVASVTTFPVGLLAYLIISNKYQDKYAPNL